MKEIVYSNGAKYRGQVNGMDQRDGDGKLEFPNNEAEFVGIFKNGQMREGKIKYFSGQPLIDECSFEGTFENNQWKEGKYKKGLATYKGTFANQTMNGYYTVTWDNGIVYNGNIKDNKLHGEGEMTFPEGNIKKVEGVWANDQMETCKMMTMANGSTADNYNP